MILDGTMQWIARTSFMSIDSLKLSNDIVKRIIEINNNDNINLNLNIKKDDEDKDNENKPSSSPSASIDIEFDYKFNIRNLHPDISLAFDIAKLSESFDESEFKNVFTFIDSLNFKTRTNFCNRIQLFLRALFLSKDPSLDCWFKIYQILLSIIKTNDLIAYDFLMTYIYKLANETHPEIQLELLRGLPNFAVSKVFLFFYYY